MTNIKVEYIDHMGNDLSVIRAATASFAKDPEEWDGEKHPHLIRYLARGMTQADYVQMIKTAFSLGGLMENMPSGSDGAAELVGHMIDEFESYRHTPTHWSPFAHTAITLRLQAPIAIHAQMMKHTVGFDHNTVSRRYVSDSPKAFVPEFRMKPTGNVKQGSGDVIGTMYYACDGSSVEPSIEFMSADRQETQDYIDKSEKKLFLTSKTQDDLFSAYRGICQEAIETYNDLIKLGVAPEQARFVLPQGVLTEWISTGSLYAWARFYNLRTDPHAQKEIQDLAGLVGKIIEPLYPVSWKALTRN